MSWLLKSCGITTTALTKPKFGKPKKRERTERGKPRQQGGRVENKDLKPKLHQATELLLQVFQGCWLLSWRQETTEGPTLFVQPHLYD